MQSLIVQNPRISLGISHGDGTLHIGFDQHDNPLHYRVSKSGVASNPANFTWSSDIFGPILVIKIDLSNMHNSLIVL